MLSEITDNFLDQMSKLVSKNKKKFYFIEEGDKINTEIPNVDVSIDKAWNFIERMSLDKDNKVLGYFQADIKRPENYVENVLIINFGDSNHIFSNDKKEFWTSLFDVYKFRKIKFNVIVGNPAESQFDKLIKKYDGRIVGILKDEILFDDGTYRDMKIYELYKNNYDKIMKKRGEIL